jgi:putative ABC transport system substrate-binding protein
MAHRQISFRASRRSLLTLLGGAAATWPLAAWAQQRSMPVIGYLRPVSPDVSPHLEAAFRKGLSETSYVEGRNVAIEYRWANNENDRLAELAADLVRRRVNVIVTPGSSRASLAAKAATTTIPIVFGGGDPVRLGLVASFNRPGGNVTGFAEMNPEIAPKRLGLLRELTPGAVRFGALFEARSTNTASATADLQAAASALGGQIEVFTVAGTIRDLCETLWESG